MLLFHLMLTICWTVDLRHFTSSSTGSLLTYNADTGTSAPVQRAGWCCADWIQFFLTRAVSVAVAWCLISVEDFELVTNTNLDLHHAADIHLWFSAFGFDWLICHSSTIKSTVSGRKTCYYCKHGNFSYLTIIAIIATERKTRYIFDSSFCYV